MSINLPMKKPMKKSYLTPMKKRMKKAMKNVFDKWLRGGGSDGHSPTGPKRALGPEASDTYEKMHETYEKSQGQICRSKSNSCEAHETLYHTIVVASTP